MELEEVIGRTHFRNEKHKLLLNMLHSHSWMVQQMRRVLQPYQLDYPAYRALEMLQREYPEPLSGKAFRYVFLDIQVKAETVLNQLRDKGLVALDKTSHAQEGGEVALTPKGIECYQELARQAEAFDRIFEALGEAQARELNVLLDQMRGEDE